ncbi:hypothetical protein JHK82_043450 [Glycine max]|nr:hypothetical protein JHK82_043450 [Glycine max]
MVTPWHDSSSDWSHTRHRVRSLVHAIAEELAEFGAVVHICARNNKILIDVWKNGINNTGTNTPKNLIDYTAEDVTTIMGTNFESSYHLCQLAHPLLKASGYGSIVFISSIAGLKALPLCSIYGPSKGAMNQLTKNIALEWAKDNIRANTVAPGPVKTLLLDSFVKSGNEADKAIEAIVSQAPVGRLGDPEDISAMVAFLCLPAASFITGQIINVDGGCTI